jgi:hypothetical protein
LKLRFIFLYTIIFHVTVLASSGLAGFEFLRVDYSARTSALAGALIAMQGDVNFIFHNPAGMAYTEDRQFCFNYNNYLLDLKSGFVGYSQRMGKLGQVSAAIAYFNYGDFEETSLYAEKTGRIYGASDLAIIFSQSNFLQDQFAYGISVKYIHSRIDIWSADAVAFDFGVIYQATFSRDLFFGFSLLNVGKSLSAFIKTKENLPLNLRIGLAKKLEHLPLVLNLSINELNVTEETVLERLKKFSIGGEFTLSEVLRLRLGYNHELNRSLKTDVGARFGGLGVGFGVLWKLYRFDFAYNSFNQLGSTFRFGISGIL